MEEELKRVHKSEREGGREMASQGQGMVKGVDIRSSNELLLKKKYLQTIKGESVQSNHSRPLVVAVVYEYTTWKTLS